MTLLIQFPEEDR